MKIKTINQLNKLWTSGKIKIVAEMPGLVEVVWIKTNKLEVIRVR